ncbi:DUF6487 domain-containing protein, partial [Dysosmobacter welbionis]
FALDKIQSRGVQQHRVLRLTQGCGVTVGIVPVPFLNGTEDSRIRLRRPPLLQLQHPAAGPLLRGSGEKHLHLRIRQHHRADIPAVHHHAVLPGQLALHLQQVRPNLRIGGYQRGVAGHLRQADLRRHIHSIQLHVLQAVRPIGQANLQVRQHRHHG